MVCLCYIESCTTGVAAVGPRRVSSGVSIDLRLRRIRRSAEGDMASAAPRLYCMFMYMRLAQMAGHTWPSDGD